MNNRAGLTMQSHLSAPQKLIQAPTTSHDLNDFLQFLKKISTNGHVDEFIELLWTQSKEKVGYNTLDNINKLIAQLMGKNIDSHGEIETLFFMHAFQLASNDAKKEGSLPDINMLLPKNKIDLDSLSIDFEFSNEPGKLITLVRINNMPIEQVDYLRALYKKHYTEMVFVGRQCITNKQNCSVCFSLKDFLLHIVPNINEFAVGSDLLSKNEAKEFKQKAHLSPEQLLPRALKNNEIDEWRDWYDDGPMRDLMRELYSLANSLGVGLTYTNFFEDTLLALADVEQSLIECQFGTDKNGDSKNNYCRFKFVNLTETSTKQLLAFNEKYPQLEIKEIKSTSDEQDEQNAKFFIMNARALRVHVLPLIKAYYESPQHAKELERYRVFSLKKNLVIPEFNKYLPLDLFRSNHLEEPTFPDVRFSTVFQYVINEVHNTLTFSSLNSILDCSPTCTNQIVFDYYYLHALLSNITCRGQDQTTLIINIDNSQAAEDICQFFNELYKNAAIKKGKGNEIYLKVGVLLHPHFIVKMSDAFKKITLNELNDREKIANLEEKQEISQLKKQIINDGSDQPILRSAVNIRFFTPRGTPPLTEGLKNSLNTLMHIERNKQLEGMKEKASHPSGMRKQ